MSRRSSGCLLPAQVTVVASTGTLWDAPCPEQPASLHRATDIPAPHRAPNNVLRCLIEEKLYEELPGPWGLTAGCFSHPAWVLMRRASSEKTVNGAAEGSAWLPWLHWFPTFKQHEVRRLSVGVVAARGAWFLCVQPYNRFLSSAIMLKVYEGTYF